MAHTCKCLLTNYFYVLKLAGQAPLSEPACIWLPPHLWVSKYVSICTQYVRDILTIHWTMCRPNVLLTM